MQLSPETRSILRQYKTLINERRRESGLSPVTTAKVLDEICESATRGCGDRRSRSHSQLIFNRAHSGQGASVLSVSYQ